MNAKRQQTATAAAQRRDTALPIVVTLDGDGGIIDIVGDLATFIGGDDSVDTVVARLYALTYGEGGLPERLGAVELSENRYADINIFFEDESRHFVLRDVSAAMQSLRARQQLDHEAELEQQRMPKSAARMHAREGDIAQGDRVFRQGAGLLEMVSTEMREALLLLSGHVQLLARRVQGDPTALASAAAMQHAVMRLDALSANALIGLGELATGREQRGMISLDGLAGFLQDSFALQAGMRGIHLELRVPETPALIEVDDLALRRLLVNLTVHALDGMDHGELRIALLAKDGSLEIELEAEPDGLSAERFGELVTTVDLLHSNAHGNLLLAASQALLQRLQAKVELVERVQGGNLLWIRVPVSTSAKGVGLDSDGGAPRDFDARVVAVALDDRVLAARVVAALQAKGIPAIETQSAGRIAAFQRGGDLRAIVVDAGHELTASGIATMMLVEHGGRAGERDGWAYDRGIVRVTDAIGDDALREALDALLA
ncbi:sensor histidine kinase [Solilutibacter silvestris]|uniref:Histidine kinase domain-containing protein n=1 Tax=Solilutibacter silvestris TaxID=1645665 RepID=A0A2K1Q180_9GAMM|nr:HAMP domain-containing histidine kinase [Lysobacter silvestris]PNS08799.1 hypothetical protein Lysil_0428 [Lysobacter silvestris]